MRNWKHGWRNVLIQPRVDFEIIDDFDYEDKGHLCIFKIPATVNHPVAFSNEEYVQSAQQHVN